MSQLVKYYAFMVLLFIVVIIYNIAFYSTFSTYACPIVTVTKKPTTANRTISKQVQGQLQTQTTTTTTQIKKTNKNSKPKTRKLSGEDDIFRFIPLSKQIPIEKELDFYSEFETDEINYLKRLYGEQDEEFEVQQKLWAEFLDDDYRLLAEEATGGTTTAAGVATKPTLVTLPLIIVIIYGIMGGLMVLAMLGIILFSDMPSERFGNLPWYCACCGIYVRNFALIIKLASYLAFLLIAIEGVLVFFAPDCGKTGTLYEQALLLVIVDAAFWGFTHCLLPLWKQQIDQEAFLYEPFDSSANMAYYVLCNLFGP